jgi:hypothetical protein
MEVAVTGLVISRDSLLSRTSYVTSDDTKTLMYRLIVSTQAVNPNDRPTIQACLEQIDAIYVSHSKVITPRRNVRNSRGSSNPTSPRLMFTPSTTPAASAAAAAATPAAATVSISSSADYTQLGSGDDILHHATELMRKYGYS